MTETRNLKTSDMSPDEIPDSYYDDLYAQTENRYIYEQDCIEHQLERMRAWG